MLVFGNDKFPCLKLALHVLDIQKPANQRLTWVNSCTIYISCVLNSVCGDTLTTIEPHCYIMVAHYGYKVVKTINMNKPWNKACYPGGHCWNYSPGALSLGKVTANQTWWSLPEDIQEWCRHCCDTLQTWTYCRLGSIIHNGRKFASHIQ